MEKWPNRSVATVVRETPEALASRSLAQSAADQAPDLLCWTMEVCESRL
jgi:hypothetical protein